jgi:hypothetical protein
MSTRQIKAIIAIITLILIYYCGSYFFFSRKGMSDGIKGANNTIIWGGFTSAKIIFSYQFTTEIYNKELIFKKIYFPLIKIDKYFGNYHVLENDLPSSFINSDCR